jgi:hypothetical protein
MRCDFLAVSARLISKSSTQAVHRGFDQPVRLLAKLAIEFGMLKGIEAALECYGVGGAIVK